MKKPKTVKQAALVVKKLKKQLGAAEKVQKALAKKPAKKKAVKKKAAKRKPAKKRKAKKKKKRR